MAQVTEQPDCINSKQKLASIFTLSLFVYIRLMDITNAMCDDAESGRYIDRVDGSM